ncbi:MAG: hypothetical protein ACOC95_03955 [Planctomycetota bacterium]
MDFLTLSPESSKHRTMQIRTFETADEMNLLSASAAVLQDLGFQVEECAADVGMLRAAKERSAREYGQEITRVLIMALGAFGQKMILIPVDMHQQINATLVTQRSQTDASCYSVRIVFYRSVWKGDGNTGDQHIPPGLQRLEMIVRPEIYRKFFAKLSKSVFLEAHEI